MKISTIILFYFLSFFGYAESAKILSIFNFPSKSYYILHSALLNALANKGHDVSLLSPFETAKNDNFTSIALSELLTYKSEYMGPMLQPRKSFMISTVNFQIKIFTDLIELFWKNQKVQDLINSQEKYDIVILSIVFNESILGLAKKLNATTISLSTFGTTPQINKLTGNPEPISYVPTMFSSLSNKMSFLQRTYNVLLYLFWQLLILKPHTLQQNLLDENIPNSPKIDDLLNEIPLILLNTHYSIESPRPYVTNLIPIGGFHVKEPKSLEEPFKIYMDSAKDGVVIMSFGSNVNITNISEKKVNIILKSLGKLNLKVIFKSEKVFDNVPGNIRIEKWIPQNDLLGHPNTKAFISHGGLLSTIESIYHGVPIIGMPMFADQSGNIARVVSDGYGVHVDITTVTEKIMDKALDSVINETSFRENIKRRSALMRDQPIKPLDNAVFWIEHVLRHRNSDHLKVEGIKLYWFQYMLLDVIIFLFFCVFCTIFIIYYAIKMANNYFKVKKSKQKFY